MLQLKIIRAGEALGEALSKLSAGTDDTVFLAESSDGYTLTSGSKGFAEEMRFADEASHKYAGALRQLAK